MIQFDKKNLDKLINLSRQFAETGENVLLDKRFSEARKLSKGAYGTDLNWYGILNIVDSMVGAGKLTNDCSDEMVYNALKEIGIEVV